MEDDHVIFSFNLIIFEFADDMEIAPDFFEYFEATAKLLEDDKCDNRSYDDIFFEDSYLLCF